MKTSNIIYSIIISFFCISVGAQTVNLVPNPSFENPTFCPDRYDLVKYVGWQSLDSSWSPPDWLHAPLGIPEYCNTCASYHGVSVPYNDLFTHNPRTGNGMVQIQMFSDIDDTNQSRDYLQVKLERPLIVGHRYHVFFYITSEQSSGYSINNIGAFLDNGAIDSTHSPGATQTQYTPQILHTSIITDTNWLKIEDTFSAKGGERFLTIGQFTDRHHTSTIPSLGTASISYSWYLVDDVGVFDIDQKPFAGNDTTINLGDSIFIGSHEPQLPFTWYVLGQSMPIASGGGIWVKPSVNTSYILKQTIYDITQSDTINVKIRTTSINDLNKNKLADLQLYPNPTSKELTIEGAKNCEVVFYDVTGKEILHSKIVTEKQALDMSSLPKDAYLVKVTDAVTGESVTKRVMKE